MSERVQTYNFKPLKKGNTFLGAVMTILVDGVLIDTSDYTIRMQLRRTASKSSPVAFEFSTEGDADGEIVRDANGKITFSPVIIDIPPGRYYHDIKFTKISTSKVSTWVQGTIDIGTVVTQTQS